MESVIGKQSVDSSPALATQFRGNGNNCAMLKNVAKNELPATVDVLHYKLIRYSFENKKLLTLYCAGQSSFSTSSACCNSRRSCRSKKRNGIRSTKQKSGKHRNPHGVLQNAGIKHKYKCQTLAMAISLQQGYFGLQPFPCWGSKKQRNKSTTTASLAVAL